MQAIKRAGLPAHAAIPKLRKYQRVGVKKIHHHITRTGGCLLGDEQGLGKTPQALVWLRMEKGALPAIVVCPSAACYVWERECKIWCTDSVTVAEKPGDLDNCTSDVVIVSYDSIRREMSNLLSRKFHSLLMDEVHYIASRTSVRFNALRQLSMVARRGRIGKRKEVVYYPRIKYRLAISGTPMPNRSVDLWTTLSILWPSSFHSFWDFASEFSYPYRPRGRAFWIFSGAKNAKKLRKLLKSHGLVRRLLEDHLKEIPSKDRRIITVRLKGQHEYNHASHNFIKWLKKISPAKAKRAKRMETFSKITYLLRLSAKLKAKRVARWIDWHIKSGEKLVVFSFVKPLLKALEQRYKGISVRIDGDVRGRPRMALIDRFQNEPDCLLALCNGKAAGVAVTLHAAHWCLIADLPWNPALLWQMEGRIHRFGQTQQTKFIYMVSKDTMEERVMEVLRGKQRIIEKVMNKRTQRTDSKDLNRLSKSMSALLIDRVMKGSK